MTQRKKKPSPKKASHPSPSLTPEEEARIQTLLENIEDGDPVAMVKALTGPRLARAFIERLPLNKEEIIPLLLALREGFNDKGVRKTVRLGLYKLKQQGLPVDEYDRQGNRGTGILRPPEEEKPVAYVGPVDGQGFRAVLITLQNHPRVLDVGMGIISDQEGIEHFALGPASKRQFRELKEDFSTEAGPLVETSLAHGATLLEEAYERHQALERPAPADYVEIRKRLKEKVTFLKRPVIYDSIPEPSVPRDIPEKDDLERLLDHGLLDSWLVPFDDLKPYMENFLQVEQSPILITDAQKREREKEIQAKAGEALYPPEKRRALMRRFEEMAHVFFKLDQEDFTFLALGAAACLGKEETLLQKNPLIDLFVEKSFNFYLEAMNNPEEEEVSRQAQRRSSSSIILP